MLARKASPNSAHPQTCGSILTGAGCYAAFHPLVLPLAPGERALLVLLGVATLAVAVGSLYRIHAASSGKRPHVHVAPVSVTAQHRASADAAMCAARYRRSRGSHLRHRADMHSLLSRQRRAALL